MASPKPGFARVSCPRFYTSNIKLLQLYDKTETNPCKGCNTGTLTLIPQLLQGFGCRVQRSGIIVSRFLVLTLLVGSVRGSTLQLEPQRVEFRILLA